MFQYRYRKYFFLSFVYLRNAFKILCNILEHIRVSEENHLALVSERMELSWWKKCTNERNRFARTNLSLYLFELFLAQTRERVYLRLYLLQNSSTHTRLYDLYEREFFSKLITRKNHEKKKGKEKERYNVISPPSVRSPVLRHDYKERAVRLLLHEKEGRKVRWTVFSYVTYADTKDNRGPLASGSVFKQKSAIKHSTRDAREHFA